MIGWSRICIWWTDATNEYWHCGMALICKHGSPESDRSLASYRDPRTDLFLSLRLELEKWIMAGAYEGNDREMIFYLLVVNVIWTLHWICLYVLVLFITVHWIRMPSSGQFPSSYKIHLPLKNFSHLLPASVLFWLPVEIVRMGLIKKYFFFNSHRY